MICTIDQALHQARNLGVNRTDALALLAHVLGRSRTELIARGNSLLLIEQTQSFDEKIQQRLNGIPVAYIVGHREFYGLDLHVTADVLDPRPDTETLVDWALSILQNASSQWPVPEVLDMGTGSGAIALAIAKNHRSAIVTASDYSETALIIAKQNAQVQQLPIRFTQSDWWGNLQGSTWDVIVSNPPYIAQGDPHLPALRHEPTMALISGPDGLDAIRTIIANAPYHLNPDGWLLLEHGYDQAHAVAKLLENAGFQHLEHRYDLAGNCRCSGGQWFNLKA